jgi:hypothetical protein
MIKCPACGLEGPDDSKFCGGCGKSIPSGPAPSLARCPSCDAEMAQGIKFCGKCGTAVGEAPAADGGTGDTAQGTPLCPGCGMKNVGEAVFCAGCGCDLRQPAPTVSSAGSGIGLSASQYLATLDARLASSGFEPFQDSPVLSLDKVYRRKKFQLMQVGMVTTFCGVKCVDYLSDVRFLQTYNKSLFDHALGNKGFFARNAFQSLLVYEVIVASGVTPEIQRFLDSYWPKHWMAYEFSVVIDLSANRMLCYSGTPLWGLANHMSFAKEATGLFSPA